MPSLNMTKCPAGIKKALDDSKDQSYVLYMLTQDQLSHIQFPLGGKMKKEAREIAEQLGFCNARKHDSQDICFVPNGDYVKFMEQYTGKHYPAGAFLDLEGQPVGRHCGAVRYTLGQRKGLGLAMGEPVYVCGKDMAANTVTVGPENALYSSMLLADDIIAGDQRVGGVEILQVRAVLIGPAQSAEGVPGATRPC